MGVLCLYEWNFPLPGTASSCQDHKKEELVGPESGVFLQHIHKWMKRKDQEASEVGTNLELEVFTFKTIFVNYSISRVEFRVVSCVK